ncbi:MAG: GNAT family N-acetyltransferase [Desulfobacterium sp.]
MKFEITESPGTKDLDFLTKKINEEVTDQGAAYPFAIFAKDESGNVLAGCNGSVIFGSIYTDQLWVDAEYRKRGIGRLLMEHVHSYGLAKGCVMTTVATMSFQVPDFYLKLGYRIDFSREGYINGSTCIFLSKKL